MSLQNDVDLVQNDSTKALASMIRSLNATVKALQVSVDQLERHTLAQGERLARLERWRRSPS